MVRGATLPACLRLVRGQLLWQAANSTASALPPSCSPADSYSWLPGSTACMRCIRGVPTACTSANCGGAAASSPATHIVSVGSMTCGLTGSYLPAVTDTCDGWGSTLKLALDVEGDCSITVTPITDTSCAEPGATGFNDLVVRAYYTTPTTIRSSLPSNAGGVSSFLFGIDQDTQSSSALTVRFWGATTKPDEASGPGSVRRRCPALAAAARCPAQRCAAHAHPAAARRCCRPCAPARPLWLAATWWAGLPQAAPPAPTL